MPFKDEETKARAIESVKRAYSDGRLAAWGVSNRSSRNGYIPRPDREIAGQLANPQCYGDCNRSVHQPELSCREFTVPGGHREVDRYEPTEPGRRGRIKRHPDGSPRYRERTATRSYTVMGNALAVMAFEQGFERRDSAGVPGTGNYEGHSNQAPGIGTNDECGGMLGLTKAEMSKILKAHNNVSQRYCDAALTEEPSVVYQALYEVDTLEAIAIREKMLMWNAEAEELASLALPSQAEGLRLADLNTAIAAAQASELFEARYGADGYNVVEHAEAFLEEIAEAKTAKQRMTVRSPEERIASHAGGKDHGSK
jgi:hypothetical protein